MSDVDPVKSDYVLDPETGDFVLRADKFDEDYIRSISKGENVFHAARRFETKVEPLQKSTFKPGKLNTEGFLEQINSRKNEEARTSKHIEKRRSFFLENDDNKNELSHLQMFNNHNEQQENKYQLRVGKLDPQTVYNPNRRSYQELLDSEEEENKENKKSAQPRIGKLKKQNLFLGRDSQDEKPVVPSHAETSSSIGVGKLDTANLFKAEPAIVEPVKMYRPTVEPKKMRVEELFPQANQESASVPNGPSSVGKMRHPFIESESAQEEEKRRPALSGARKLNKGNRISCLIENLATNERPAGEDDDLDPEDKEVEELKLGKARLAQIQSLFSGCQEESESPELTGQRARGVNQDKSNQIAAIREKLSNLERSDSTVLANTDFDELRGEGLVSMNLERFTTGNILGNQVMAARKLQAETNYIDKKHIEAVTAKFEQQSSGPEADEEREVRPIGKLRDPAEIFSQDKPEHQQQQQVRVGKLNIQALFEKPSEDDPSAALNQPVRVGKLNTSAIFNAKTETKVESNCPRVGKLNADNIFAKQEEEDKPRQSSIRVGKLNTQNLFQSQQEEETEARQVRVGKLNTDNLFNNKREESPVEAMKTQKIGKINLDNLFNKDEEAEDEREAKAVPAQKIGKINTDNLFQKREEAVKHTTPKKIGKLKTDQLFANRDEEDEERVEICSPRIGKINTENLFSKREDEERLELPSPKIGKINTENLFSKKDEVDKADLLPSPKIGKINTENLFAKKEEAKAETPSPKIGKINTENLFQKQEAEEKLSPSPRIGKINTDNLFSKKEDDRPREHNNSPKSIGKINTENLFAKKEDDPVLESSPQKIGKINTENLFAKKEQDEDESSRESSVQKIGKIDTSNLFAEAESKSSPKTTLKVGRLSGIDKFDYQSEEVSSQKPSYMVSVGKLSEDRMQMNSNLEAGEGDTEPDTHIVPAGTVSKSASMFLNQGKPASENAPSRSQSFRTPDDVAELKRKYQEQTLKNEVIQEQDNKQEDHTEIKSGKMQEARNMFFQSMMTSSNKGGSAQRLGTSILPSKGKQLFQKMAEQQEAVKEKPEILPGVDFEEIEEEFERLHREMVESD